MKKMMTMLVILTLFVVTLVRAQIETGVKCDSSLLGHYLPSTLTCSRFFICGGLDGDFYWLMYQCPGGLEFNETTLTCNMIGTVTHNCGCDEPK